MSSISFAAAGPGGTRGAPPLALVRARGLYETNPLNEDGSIASSAAASQKCHMARIGRGSPKFFTNLERAAAALRYAICPQNPADVGSTDRIW